jgi:hypothetical protein
MTIAPDTHRETLPSPDELEQLENELSELAGRVETVAMRLKRVGDAAEFENERAYFCGQGAPTAPLLTLADVGRAFLFTRYVLYTAEELGNYTEEILGCLEQLAVEQRERAA